MLNLGIIGAGAVVQGAHVAVIKAAGDVEVVAVADPVEPNRRAIGDALGCSKTSEDYRSVLDDPKVQAVDICLPHFMHERVVLDAFEAGKDVLLEKPIALTLDEADRMIAAAATHGRQFYVSLNQRFYPAHRRLKEILNSGEYGKPFLALAQLIGDEFARMNVREGWKGTWDRAGGGALADTGTHIIDLMLWWFGRPKTVSCHYGRFMVEPDNKGDDNVCVTLGYDGMLADVVVSYSAISDAWTEYKQVYFPKDSIHITMAPEHPMLHGANKQPHQPVPVEAPANWWTSSVGASVAHFLECLAGKAEPWFGPEAARDTLEIILLAYKAANEGRTLGVPARNAK
ncbi:MAG TPA: Gfo/Idh/MocA family oxidoreductase [Candidatus Hydrogenedentes bacterium]|nr:Gfo/Idh/MocA family oxidoreductase [Candidatus Hydrogenedentota bacterium]HPG69322.1 Gfo/Idh/MocA family oxidoreductase [Candidatus Hydrogenedentota bacterium]